MTNNYAEATTPTAGDAYLLENEFSTFSEPGQTQASCANQMESVVIVDLKKFITHSREFYARYFFVCARVQ